MTLKIEVVEGMRRMLGAVTWALVVVVVEPDLLAFPTNLFNRSRSITNQRLPFVRTFELEDYEMAEVTKFLRMSRTASLRYLDNVDKENFARVKDYLPGVYVGEVGKPGDEVDNAQREWQSERRRASTRSGQR